MRLKITQHGVSYNEWGLNLMIALIAWNAVLGNF